MNHFNIYSVQYAAHKMLNPLGKMSLLVLSTERARLGADSQNFHPSARKENKNLFVRCVSYLSHFLFGEKGLTVFHIERFSSDLKLKQTPNLVKVSSQRATDSGIFDDISTQSQYLNDAKD